MSDYSDDETGATTATNGDIIAAFNEVVQKVRIDRNYLMQSGMSKDVVLQLLELTYGEELRKIAAMFPHVEEDV